MSENDVCDVWCLIDCQQELFSVAVSLEWNVEKLRQAIQQAKLDLLCFDIRDIVLLKLNAPIPVDPDPTLAQRLPKPVADFSVKLDRRTRKIFDVFPGGLAKDYLHIIVKVPVSNESNVSSVPRISTFWSPRFDTVRQLYEVLLKEKLVHVRGTPGCGKTTLLTLLHSHILNQLPSAFVRTVSSWRPIVSQLAIDQRLKEIDPAFPRRDSLAFLLFDDGQDSYSDAYLWNSFIKEVGDGIYPYYRVVMFCSYGSPSSHPVSYDIGTLPTLRAAARISLWPVKGGSLIGILLQWSEFLEVVSRFERPLNVHPDLLSMIFDWTAGHAGAVVELLRMISYTKVSEVRRGETLTVQDFLKQNPLHVLVRTLDGGAFGRGLPRDFSDLTDVVAFFRTLLKDRKFERKENQEEDDAVRMCHRRGWIHATAIPGRVRYTLPSPLHEVCLSWTIEPTDDMPHFTSLLELSLETITKFKPSQLQLTLRRVASESTNLPEAQYQDEFYNSLSFVTSGNVRISPEYASAKGARKAGRIDFFVPIVKWGIEITRDGNRLLEHAARFTDSGAYGAWLESEDMKDYILLDCRIGIPRDKHPKIPNLYHVVFRNECQEVVVYDNCLEVVKGPIVLQENHH